MWPSWRHRRTLCERFGLLGRPFRKPERYSRRCEKDTRESDSTRIHGKPQPMLAVQHIHHQSPTYPNQTTRLNHWMKQHNEHWILKNIYNRADPKENGWNCLWITCEKNMRCIKQSKVEQCVINEQIYISQNTCRGDNGSRCNYEICNETMLFS